MSWPDREVFTMRELNAEIAELAGQSPDLVDVPDFMAAAMRQPRLPARARRSTRDQWLMLQKDNVASGKQPGFKAFGITPTPMAAAAPEWLSRFRKGGRFAPRREYHSAG